MGARSAEPRPPAEGGKGKSRQDRGPTERHPRARRTACFVRTALSQRSGLHSRWTSSHAGNRRAGEQAPRARPSSTPHQGGGTHRTARCPRRRGYSSPGREASLRPTPRGEARPRVRWSRLKRSKELDTPKGLDRPWRVSGPRPTASPQGDGSRDRSPC